MSQFDYQTLIAARADLWRKIGEGHEHPTYRENPLFKDPDKLMRAYGLLAKLDAEILQVESRAYGEWIRAREGSN